jgi:NitT/TauT family transport system substrate-binding protein
MSDLTRRQFLHAVSTAPVWPAAAQPRATGDTRVRLLLNSGFSSVNAWFLLAEDRGYFRDAGLAVEFADGRGAYTAAGRMADEAFDVGYGDVNALVELAAGSNPRAPIAVYMMFNRSPSVVAVPSDSPVRGPADLAGRHLRGHATDVALQTFPALAASHGVDATRVRISTSEDGMGAVVERMLRGETDGTFGYESTITAALVTAKIPPARVRFLYYRDLVPDLYGSALMVSRRLVQEHPALVAGLVRAVNRGVREVVADPVAALNALKRRLPTAVDDAERARLDLTLRGEMAHPEVRTRGIGAVEPTRLARGIALLCSSKRLARVPAVDEVFNPAFSIQPNERVTTLDASRG